MKRTALTLFLLTAPAAAQSFADGTAFGGSGVFSTGENPLGDPARFDQVPEGYYLAFEAGDFKPRGAHDAAGQVVQAERDPSLLPSAFAALSARPWAARGRAYGVAWAWAGGIRFGFTHEDLRGTFATLDPALAQITLEARQAVVDRLYAGAGSQAGRTAFGFLVRLERTRFGQESLAFQPGPGQLPLGDPEAPLGGLVRPASVTSATLNAGLIQDLGERVRFGLTLDRIGPRRFGDLKEEPQARAGLQADLGASLKLSLESDLTAAERVPIPVKRRVQAASLRIDLSPATFLTLGAERSRYDGAPQSTVFGAALHLQMPALRVALGLRFGDDRPPFAAALRWPGAP